MKLYTVCLLYLLIFASCNVFEDEISFVDIEDKDRVKYVITLIDSLHVSEYSKYINNDLVEKNIFVYDSIKTEKHIFNNSNKLIEKRAYIFSEENYQLVIDTIYISDKDFLIDSVLINKNEFVKRRNAIKTIDSVFYSDSILVKETGYSYSDSLLGESNVKEYTVDGIYYMDRYFKNFYNNDKNIVKVNYENTIDAMCSYELQYYTNHLNLIDLERFENRLLGPYSKNLVHNAYWEKSCNIEDYKVNASSTYSYEFNADGYVITRTEHYTPSYKEFVGTVVERQVKIVEYEYKYK